MKRYLRPLIFLACIVFCQCDDVFEENISNDTIAIVAPLDGTIIEGNFVQFRWSFLDGADNYRVQLFNEDQVIVLDSSITLETFNFQINPGDYQWRVRGENFAFVTPYTLESSFSVITSDDLSDQVVVLNAPRDNSYFNTGNVNFGWSQLMAADFYDFQILDGTTTDSEILFESNSFTNTDITVNTSVFDQDRTYLWRVRAGNDTSMTSFFQRTILKDTTAPPLPTLLTPTNGASFSSETDIMFSWGFSDTGDVQSPITGVLEVASDENFVNIIFSEMSENQDLTTRFSNSGDFFWRIQGVDAAGNMGEYNSTGGFTIN